MSTFIKKAILTLTCCLAYAGAQTNENVSQQPYDELRYVFRSGTVGYHTFRCPAVIRTAKGTLIAFAEGTVKNKNDFHNIDIVARRSIDGGRTWGELFIVQSDGKNQCGSPAPVIDELTGRIFLLSCGSRGTEKELTDAPPRREVYIQYSDDDGETWTKRRNISEQVKPQAAEWYSTGPGSGVQIRQGTFQGRLIIPASYSDENHVTHSLCLYSDDKGENWKRGLPAGPGSDENQIAEVSPDVLIQNIRMKTNNDGYRAIRRSGDGGKTWTELMNETSLPDPACQASVIRDYSDENLLYFSNPAAIPRSRNGMTIRVSQDGGSTWPFTKVVYSGPSGYSNLVIIDEFIVGIVFEGGGSTTNQGIAFKRFLKENLLVKDTPPTVPR